MSGLPEPAEFTKIIKNLFQNEDVVYSVDGKTIKIVITFSRVQLTTEQSQSLIIPAEFQALQYYILYQTDVYEDNVLVRTTSSLVSFLQKQAEYIYGYYYTIANQSRIDTHILKCSRDAILLDSTATFSADNYLEVYNKIKSTTVILGLSTQPNNIYASLQYKIRCNYFYQVLNEFGIANINDPPTLITGLSKNLKEY